MNLHFSGLNICGLKFYLDLDELFQKRINLTNLKNVKKTI